VENYRHEHELDVESLKATNSEEGGSGPGEK